MPAAAQPAFEHSRQALLEALGILDTAPETDYDDLVRIAAGICRVPTALVSLIDDRRQWFKARFGMALEETPREVSFCAHAILSPGEVMHVPDARADERFADNPLVLQDGIQFYAGAPILVEGLPIGTVCVIDREPRELDAAQVEALQALARQAARLIELRRVSRLLSIQLRERDWYERQLRQGGSGDAAGQVDALTGLPGPQAFAGTVDEEIWLRNGTGGELQVALIEIDDLASLDGLHGAGQSEEALRALAGVLRAGLVEGRLARVGTGFGLLMPLPLAQAVAQCRRVAELAGNPAAGIPVTLSIGMARVEPGEGGGDAIETATHALAQARGAGGDRIEVR